MQLCGSCDVLHVGLYSYGAVVPRIRTGLRKLTWPALLPPPSRRFVLRFFMLHFWSRGAARRYLRNFMCSVRHHLKAADKAAASRKGADKGANKGADRGGRDKHPRLYAFAVLTGVEKDDNDCFNVR